MGLVVEVGWLDTTPPSLWTLEDPVLGEIDLDGVVIDGFGVPDGATFESTGTDKLHVETRRGKPTDLDDIVVGEATVVLRNDHGDYDPDNESSPWWPGVRRGRPIRIHDGTETAWVFTGVIDDVIVDYDEAGLWSTATLRCVDMLAALGGTTLEAHDTVEQSTGERVAFVLDVAEVSWTDPRDLDDGWVTCGTQGIAAGTNPLNYLSLVARAELGRLFVAGDGTLTFRDYPSTVGATPACTFDNTAGSDGIRYTGVRKSSPSSSQWGRVQATATGSSEPQIATYDDAEAEGRFVRTLKLDDLPVVDDTEALTVAQAWASRVGPTRNRISWIEVDLRLLTSGQRTTVMGLDVGDVVVVRHSAPGVAQVEQVCAVEMVEHVEDGPVHVVRLHLSAATLFEFWTLEDPVLGEIDADYVLSFG